jgi:hypothetical protein
MSGHVQMAESDPEAQRKSSLSDCTWLENENGSFKLEALNALLENRGVHFTHTHIFFLFLIFLILFFLSFFLPFIIYTYIFSCETFTLKSRTSPLNFFHSSFFFKNTPLWTQNCTIPTSCPMLRCCSSSSKEAINKVGTGNIFPLDRYLKSSMSAPSCDPPWIGDPFSTIGCGQRGNHKRWYGFKGGYPARFVRSPMRGYTMHG